jgi:hypothetical protein
MRKPDDKRASSWPEKGVELSRRELLHRLSLLLGTTISAPVAAGLLAGCRARPGDAENGRSLDADGLRIAGALAERILPRTETPGALDARVELYIDTMLSDFFTADERTAYLEGLARLEVAARQAHGRGFADCTAAQQDTAVARLDGLAFPSGETSRSNDADAVFFRLHKELTVAGYYTSQPGQMEELRLMPFGQHEPDIPLGPDDTAWA